MPKQDVLDFIRDTDSGRFDELALRAFRFQYEAIAPYRALCDAHGATPSTVDSWTKVPAVPTLAFKTIELVAAKPVEVFRSSGTSGQRSVHHHPFPELYEAAIDHSFPDACLAGLPTPLPILGLVPNRALVPDSSLAFMVDHVVDRWGDDSSRFAVGPRGVDVAAARSWIGAHQRANRPVLVVATSLALDDLLVGFERRYLHFRLPPGSVVFETGGSKGRSRAVDPDGLRDRIQKFLGVPRDRVVVEYGMTELSSQCYSSIGANGAPATLTAPPWVRVRALDPVSLEEVPAGEPGLLAIFDLANLGSAVHVLTEDLGAIDPDGSFRLQGRAEGAELRGCSLTVEELATGVVS